MELEAEAPLRLDQQVVKLRPELSRSTAAKLIDAGKVSVNGSVQTKVSFHVGQADQIVIDYNPYESAPIPDIDLPIIYEDKDCVVIDKPAGVLTHSKGAFNPEATVATWLANKATGLSGDRAGIVHRLDRATSGVLIAAKNPEALSWLQKQFSTRKVKKSYIAVVQGHLKQPLAIIDMPLERNPKRPQTFRAGVNGKTAITEYKLLQEQGPYSELQLMPLTGRTHQLRVHLSHLGHPIVGDTLYGGQPATRLFLHAQSLEITLPNRQRQTFNAALPAEFKELLTDD